MSQWRGGFSCRNLTKSQLGGVVFGCTKQTFKECMSKQLFGLPNNHMTYVQKIDVGLPLFLFNYTDRKLHGIFEAAGPGQLNIDPYGWTSNGSERTTYPAQVQVRVQLQCEPLSEEKFKPAIEDNYYSSHHFWFELDHFQTNKLKCLLAAFAVEPKPPIGTSISRQVFHFPPSSETKENTDEAESSKNEPVDSLEVSLTSGRESNSSATASHPDISEIHSDVQNPKQKDKDYVLEKLKDLALSNVHQGKSLMKTVDQANIPTCKNLEDRDILEEDTCLEGKGDGSSLVSSPRRPTINQLMHEVKELRAYGMENSTKICYLEEKLDEAHKEIYRLRERCNMLESLSSPLISKTGGSDMEIPAPDYSSLDPTEAILLLGGFDGYSWFSSVESYFPSKNVVKTHSSMSCIRSNASVAKLDGKIYVFGGDNGGNGWSDTVESYNQTDGQWSLCPSLNERKGNLGGAALDGKIFAIGGGNGVVSFEDVEMLDPDIGRWIRTRSMEQKRFAVASSEHNGSIYAVGGFDGKEYLNTAERFDPREHSWMKIASMKSTRSCHSLLLLNEKLYAIGGFDGSTMVSSVEIYDPRKGTWTDGEPMKELRGYSAAAVVKDSIYVIGGYKGEEEGILDTVECFKEGEGWKNVPCSSIGRRGFLSAVAL